MNDENSAMTKPRYVWPWFALAALLLGVVLAILWMSAEVRRTRERREWTQPPAEKPANAQSGISAGGTNAAAP